MSTTTSLAGPRHTGVKSPFRPGPLPDAQPCARVALTPSTRMARARDSDCTNFLQLDPAPGEALAKGDEQRATELERGARLFIFLRRGHGVLLQAVGQPRLALQDEIGNPHTASR
jgi:hypothetical protein